LLPVSRFLIPTPNIEPKSTKIKKMLSDLPFEVLTDITVHLPTGSSLRALSLTCKRLHDFVEKEGYRVFVQTRFPSIETPPLLWKDATRALTSNSKAWDRKAFVAQELDRADVANPRERGERRRGRSWGNRQTMGYVPIIDSYESFQGGKWSNRREVLVWGAGAEIVMRLKGANCPPDDDEKSTDSRPANLEMQDEAWRTFKAEGFQDGIEDVTAAHILRPHQRTGHEGQESLIIGRASGKLDLLTCRPDSATLEHIGQYFTASKSIRSTDLSKGDRPLLAACVSDLGLLLYEGTGSDGLIEPTAGIDIGPPTENGGRGRTWTTKFLCDDRLAIGLGPVLDALHVYQITPSHVLKEPAYKLREESSNPTSPATSSVYAITPLPPSTPASGSPGDLFLSGWYNSHIKLHDLRTPKSAVATFNDTADTSPIYSLLPIGHERFLAGAGRDALLKIYDLRLPGGRQYSYHSLSSQKSTSSDSWSESESGCGDGDFNVFLHAHSSTPGARRSSPRNSPTYCLSTPSPTSSTIYIGLEATVLSLSLLTTEDIVRRRSIQSSLYHSSSRVLPLAGYERPPSTTEAVRLLGQEDVRRYLEPTGNFAARYRRSGENECVKGWDCRWRPQRLNWNGGERGRLWRRDG
jgi:hypothetical protein